MIYTAKDFPLTISFNTGEEYVMSINTTSPCSVDVLFPDGMTRKKLYSLFSALKLVNDGYWTVVESSSLENRAKAFIRATRELAEISAAYDSALKALNSLEDALSKARTEVDKTKAALLETK